MGLRPGVFDSDAMLTRRQRLRQQEVVIRELDGHIGRRLGGRGGRRARGDHERMQHALHHVRYAVGAGNPAHDHVRPRPEHLGGGGRVAHSHGVRSADERHPGRGWRVALHRGCQPGLEVRRALAFAQPHQ